jgi:hypothetical protein
MSSNETSRAAFSIPSIIAVVAAILSFSAGAFFGLILAGVAIVMGVIGILLAISPARRGGIFSMAAVVAGLAGIIAAVIKAIMWVVG